MANYDSNYAIAQEISARIGVSPIPFDSVYSIALEIYNELGGEPTQFDSVYSILLGILPLVEGGVASKVIDDNVITTVKTWSSSKINSELSGKAIEEVSELPNASENKDKLFRLDNGEKDVYAAKLLSSETTTTNRLPDEQQIDNAYLYKLGKLPYYYKGSFKVIFSDTEIDGYGWLEDGDTLYFILTEDDAVNIKPNSIAYGFLTSDKDTIDLVNKTITTDKVSTEQKFTLESVDGTIEIPIPAIYNAPESAQIGNAYLTEAKNWNTVIYDGTQVTFIDNEGSGEEVTGYKWLIDGESDYVATSKPASEIYFYNGGDWFVTDSIIWNVDADGSASERTYIASEENGIYIPQLNAPDSEQVDNATLVQDDITWTYDGNQTTITYNGNTINVYTWKYILYNDWVGVYSTKPASEIFSKVDADFYRDDSGIYKCEGLNAISNLSIVPWKRTEVTEEWDWLPLTDNATNDDIDAMFESSPVVKRVLMKDSEKYGYSINEGWINFNDETMSYDGGTYYKWLKYSESSGGEAERDGNYYILTDTLNPTLPFDVNSNECVYCFEIESEGVTYRIESSETYSKEALIHEDGSITYEE